VFSLIAFLKACFVSSMKEGKNSQVHSGEGSQGHHTQILASLKRGKLQRGREIPERTQAELGIKMQKFNNFKVLDKIQRTTVEEFLKRTSQQGILTKIGI
jgi:hypothetical protein